MFSRTKYVQKFMWDKYQTFLVASMVFYDWRPRPLVAWMVETHFHDRIGSFRLGKGIGLEDCFDQMENTRELPTFTDVS